MFICARCEDLERIALAPSGTRNFVDIEPEDHVCFSCLGLLQTFVTKQFINSLAELIEEKKFQHKFVRTSILLPSCLYLRQHIMVRKLMGDGGLRGVDLRVCLLKRMSYLKSAWRELVVPHLEKAMGITHIDGDASDNNTPFFDVMLTFDYAYNDIECSPLFEYFPKRLQHVKPLKRPVEEYKNSLVITAKQAKPSQFTLLAVIDAICCVPLNETSKYFESVEKEVSSHPVVALSLVANPLFTSQSIYIYGRYRKMCRDLPQSAWAADDADADDVVVEQPGKHSSIQYGRYYKSSIEQLIGDPLLRYTSAESYRFSAAGREDVDVRMLGSGRPFCIQLVNPKVPYALTPSSLNEINIQEILEKFGLEFFDLQETLDRFPVDMLKRAEGQKEKEYTAVCFVRSSSVELPGIEEICEKINAVACPIELKQKTPIRVLHRRSPVVRIRHVLKMHATPFKNSQNVKAFSLRLRTDAGTYVKEFVHGDFGRTVPNIAQLISRDYVKTENEVVCDVDIVTLDVTDISDLKMLPKA